MPRFFVDFWDNGIFFQDDVGSDLESFDKAQDEAVQTLSEIARDRLPDGKCREFVAAVRDEAGSILYRATLAFHDECPAEHRVLAACDDDAGPARPSEKG